MRLTVRSMRAADRFVQARHPPNALFLWGCRVLRRNNSAITGLSNDEIRALLRSDDLARQCVLNEVEPGTTPRDILLRIQTGALLGPAVNLLTKIQAPTGALAEALHEVIVLDGGGPFGMEIALQVVQRVPERVVEPHRTGIFKKIWMLASQPIDPYRASPLNDAARVAAAALLAVHLDCRVAALPTLSAPKSGHLRQLIYAASLQTIEFSRGAAFGELIEQVKPSTTEALTLGRASDQDVSTTDPVHVTGRRARMRSFGEQVRVWGGTNARPYLGAIVALGVPLVSVGAAFLTDWILGLPHHLTLSTTPLLTVAAVLVAVHVFAAELGADRLPGLVARGTSVPVPLWSGYLSIGALMLLAVTKPDKHDTAFYSIVGIGLIAAVIVGIAATLRRLLSRTDRAVAAQVFTRGELSRMRRTGRFVGRLNTSVVRSRAAFTALPWVRPAPAPPIAFRRREIRVQESGFLSIDLKRLGELNAQDWWHGGARLWLYGVLGSQVEVNDDVASLVPAPDDDLPVALVDSLQDLFVVRSAARVDRTAEAVSALIEITAELGNEGNEQGASHVSSEVARLLREHRAAIGSTNRESVDPHQAGAPVAVSRAAALSAVRSLRAAQGPAAVEALTRLIQRSLPGCQQGDPFLSILLIQLVDQRRDLEQGTLRILLEDCGRQSLESRDQLAFNVWGHVVKTLVDDAAWRDVAIASGSYFVQVAAATDRGRGDVAWERFAPHLDLTVVTDSIAALCVGASVLVSGRVSLATAVAIKMRGSNWSGWRQIVGQARFLDHVTTTDESRGAMLGENPEGALNDFIALAAAVATHVH